MGVIRKRKVQKGEISSNTSKEKDKKLPAENNEKISKEKDEKLPTESDEKRKEEQNQNTATEEKSKTEDNIIEPKETLSRKFFEYFKVFIKIMLLIILAPGLINFAALFREEKELKPEGFMIDIRHGQKLFKTCLGKGTPTVLLEAPLGSTSDAWFHVLNEVAKFTKVCTYDRAGLGFSDRPFRDANTTKRKSKPYTVESSVEDFHKLFETEERPFVLVGSDYGASIMKFYAQMYPDTVASLLFINPLFDGLFMGEGNLWNEFWFRTVMGRLQLQQVSSLTGLTRIGLRTGLIREPYSFKNVPDIIKLRQKYLLCNMGHVSSLIEEYYHLNESLAQLRTLKKLRSIPPDVNVTLIFSDKYDDTISADMNKVWLKSQEFVQQEFNKETTLVVKYKGFFPKLFFTAPKKLVKVIKDNISNWKKSKTLKF